MVGAEQRDDLRRGQAAAAEVEEVGVRSVRRGADDLLPHLRDHGGRAVQAGVGRVGGRERPRQGVAVDLAGGAGGDVVDDREPRDQRGRHGRAQVGGGCRGVVLGCGGEVADQQLVAGRRTTHGRGRRGDPGEGQQRGVDLAELDPAPAQLDLVVGAAGEEQPGGVVDDDVAAAVGAVPAEGRHRGVLLGVLGRVEVARQSDAADDQLAALPLGDRLPGGGVDHDEVPAGERQADPHRTVCGHQRAAGDDGGLGRPVGVPHLATVA